MSTLLVTCVDGRLHDHLHDLEERLGVADGDRLQVPGGPLALVTAGAQQEAVAGWIEFLARATYAEIEDDVKAFADSGNFRSARAILDDWENQLPLFWRVAPVEQVAALEAANEGVTDAEEAEPVR